MTIVEAIILAVIEGLTEFLPVSSTGHMIIGSSLMGIAEDPFVKMFTVAIQFGAILSVVVLYHRRFFQSFKFYLKLFIAFLPAAVIGLIFIDYIDMLFENVIVVSVMLVLGGVVLLFVDKWFKSDGGIDVDYKKSFNIGLFQVLAMIPGVSRSAATIIGGLSQKLTKKAAAEFSFFLAVPTMFAASGYKVFKYHNDFGFKIQDFNILLIGSLTAFIVAMLAIKSFVSYVTRHGFKIFGYYRILVGLIILALYFMGYDLEIM